MMYEIDAIKKWFMKRQGVDAVECIRIEPGIHQIPIGPSVWNVEITNSGGIAIKDKVQL